MIDRHANSESGIHRLPDRSELVRDFGNLLGPGPVLDFENSIVPGLDIFASKFELDSILQK